MEVAEMDNKYISTYVELSTQKCVENDEAEGPTEIGGFKVCTNGLAAYRDYHGVHPRQPVRREEVEIAKTFLKLCRPMKVVQPKTCPISSTLKHQIERWAPRYISTGAVIVAALEMGIPIEPYYGEGPRDDTFEPRNAVIGVNIRDVERLVKDVWP